MAVGHATTGLELHVVCLLASVGHLLVPLWHCRSWWSTAGLPPRYVALQAVGLLPFCCYLTIFLTWLHQLHHKAAAGGELSCGHFSRGAPAHYTSRAQDKELRR